MPRMKLQIGKSDAICSTDAVWAGGRSGELDEVEGNSMMVSYDEGSLIKT